MRTNLDDYIPSGMELDDFSRFQLSYTTISYPGVEIYKAQHNDAIVMNYIKNENQLYTSLKLAWFPHHQKITLMYNERGMYEQTNEKCSSTFPDFMTEEQYFQYSLIDDIMLSRETIDYVRDLLRDVWNDCSRVKGTNDRL